MALKKGTTAENLNPEASSEAPAPAPTAATLQDHSEPAGDTPWDDTPATAPAATVTQAPAPVPAPSNAPAVRPTNMVSQVTQNDGFEDLDGEIGFGSFPIVKLDKDKFEVDGESLDEFDCVMLQARNKWIYKVKNGDEEDMFYSYDEQTDTSGRSIQDRYSQWAAEGYDVTKVEIRKYLEVMVKMLSGKLADSLALLSVPPASVKRFGGYRAEVAMAHKRQLNSVITTCTKGTKVQINPKISFYPWNFKFKGAYEG